MKELKKVYIKRSDGEEYYVDLDAKNNEQDERINANAQAISENSQNDESMKDEILRRVAELQLSIGDQIDALRETLVTKEEYEQKETELNARLEDLTNNIDTLKTAGILTDSLQQEVKALADVVSTKKSNVVTNVTELDSTTYTANEDVTLYTTDTLTKSLTVTGKNVDINDFKINNNVLKVSASGIINFDKFVSTGIQDKATQGNANVSINNSNLVRIVNSKFLNSGYNTLEIGLTSTSKPSNIVIDNCEFGDTSNNSVSIFNTANDCNITIKNCKFGTVSNVLRLSNRDNVNFTVNIINCDFTDVESLSPEYRSIIVCQDYSDKTPEAIQESNRFAPEKAHINFVNCTLKGEKLTELQLGTGENKPNSLVYVHTAEGNIEYEGNETRYPAVTVS